MAERRSRTPGSGRGGPGRRGPGRRGPGRRGPGHSRGEDPRRAARAPGARTESEAPVDPETVTQPVPAQAGGTTGPQPATTPVPAGEETRGAASRARRRVHAPRRLSQEERNRRRFARRQWARRWLAWRAVLAVAVLLAVVGGAGWVVLVSSALGVEDVEVSGTQLLGERQVTAVADVPDGEPLARVDLAAIERRVESLAEVEDATVTRAWPHQVSVRVRERRAIAVVRMSGRLRGMDDEGVLFRDFGSPPRGLPRVDMPSGTSSDAMLEAARVIQALPGDLVPRVDHVEVGSMDAISLVLGGGRRVVWGSASESDAKAEVMAALLRAVPAQVYDVSVPGQPTTTQQP